jgi:UDP-N-acetylglucosamine 2-epimerase (non-hydrolysing)
MHSNPTNTSFLEVCISKLSEIFQIEKPNFIIVQGDTFSAAAGAIAGYLNQIPVGHVEAGLRSNNLNSPWPEEGLRRMIDGVAKLLWAPTARDVIPVHTDQEIQVVGNTIADAVRLIVGRKEYIRNIEGPIVVTLHRRESFGETMVSALNSLVRLSEVVKQEIIFLQHPNPMVANAIEKSRLSESSIRVISPLPYVEFMKLISSSSLIITDSGGIQEESSILNIPTIILRDTTERMDALEKDRSVLSPSDGSNLLHDASQLFEISAKPVGNSRYTFGDGYSSNKIVDDLKRLFIGDNHAHS